MIGLGFGSSRLSGSFMLVTHCPRCQESVRVPDSISADRGVATTQVKCPWCLATMSSSEINAGIPPALVILGDEAELQAAGVSSESWAAGTSNTMGSVSDLEGHGDTYDQSQLDTVAEIDPIDLASEDRSTDDSSEELMELEEMDLVAGETPETVEDSDLDEFQIADQPTSAETKDTPAVAPVRMDIESTPRRRSRGSGWKSIVGVALGGLLALPIVGGILHVLGKPVPVIGPILNEYIPMGNQSVAKRASAPMAMDPPVLLDDEPVQGRSLSDELSPDQLNPGGVAPADAALAEITGDADPNSPEPSSDESLEANSSEAMNESSLDASDSPDTDVPLPGSDVMPDPDAIFEPDSAAEPDAEPADAESMPAVAELNEDSPEPSSDPSLAADLFGGGEMGRSFADSDADNESLPENESTAADESQPAEAPMPAVIEPDADPAFDIDGELNRLEGSLAKISSMPSEDPARAETVDRLYSDLSTLAGQADADSIEKARPLMSELASNMSLVKAFAFAAPEWFNRADQQRETDGALVVGKLSGEPGNATILLSNKQSVPVTLPSGATEVPGGIQLGLGTIEGSGDGKKISLELLQGL